MKTLFILITVFSLGLFTSCNKENLPKLTQFNLEYETYVTIENNGILNVPISFYSPETESNAEAEFAVNDTRKDKIQTIFLTELRLEITHPDYQDFDFLKDAEFFITAEGLDEIILAYKYDINNSIGDVLYLTCSETDFQEYIKKDTFTLKVKTVHDETILEDLTIKVSSKFLVDAKLIGNA